MYWFPAFSPAGNEALILLAIHQGLVRPCLGSCPIVRSNGLPAYAAPWSLNQASILDQPSLAASAR